MTAQLTPSALEAISASGECTGPIFRMAEMANTAKHCSCGYPSPCGFNVPVTRCRLYRADAIAATGEHA